MEASNDEEYQWKFFEMIQIRKVDQQGVRTFLEEMEDMVRHEGLTQIINLLVEDQIDNIMFRELFDSDDLGDWMRCVAEEEEKRNDIFF
jgi:hypothetical protein